MSMIWQYDATMPAPHEYDLTLDVCAFCHQPMACLMESVGRQAGGTRVRACPGCGWWTYWQQTSSVVLDPDTWRPRWSLYGALAQLKALDVGDVSKGLNEVRQFLLAKYEARFELHPRLFELTVTSVFRDLGYDAEATAYSADGGVDVILRRPDGTTSGVQVKRVKAAVEVEQIRALAGALVLGGHAAGVYVTTSSFRSGAAKAVARLRDLSMPVELVDAARFFEALRVTQRTPYESYEDWQDHFGDPPDLATIYEGEMEGG